MRRGRPTPLSSDRIYREIAFKATDLLAAALSGRQNEKNCVPGSSLVFTPPPRKRYSPYRGRDKGRLLKPPRLSEPLPLFAAQTRGD